MVPFLFWKPPPPQHPPPPPPPPPIRKVAPSPGNVLNALYKKTKFPSFIFAFMLSLKCWTEIIVQCEVESPRVLEYSGTSWVLQNSSPFPGLEYLYKGEHYVLSLLINIIKAVLLIGGGVLEGGGDKTKLGRLHQLDISLQWCSNNVINRIFGGLRSIFKID